MSMPKVSVVIATYRREEELAKALYSLSEQTDCDYEVVLVDDNGDERWNNRVRKVLEAFTAAFPDISVTYIANQMNLGSAQTRNVGIRHSKGEYVTFLDDDDVYLPKKIEKQCSFMKTNGLDYSITDLELINSNGKRVDRRIRYYLNDMGSESLLECHLKYHLTGTDTMMFRRSYLLKIGCFAPIDVGDEFYLMERAIEGKGKFGYLPECDVRALIHIGEESLSSGRAKIDGENALYKHKKSFFEEMSKNSVKFIKTRHFAVLAYAYLRGAKYVNAFWNAVRAFIISPKYSFAILADRGHKNREENS